MNTATILTAAILTISDSAHQGKREDLSGPAIVAELKAAHAQQLEDLYAQIGRLTTQLNWLKKKLPPSLIAPDER